MKTLDEHNADKVKGAGVLCPRCRELMQYKEYHPLTPRHPKDNSHWVYCPKCNYSGIKYD